LGQRGFGRRAGFILKKRGEFHRRACCKLNVGVPRFPFLGTKEGLSKRGGLPLFGDKGLCTPLFFVGEAQGTRGVFYNTLFLEKGGGEHPSKKWG